MRSFISPIVVLLTVLVVPSVADAECPAWPGKLHLRGRLTDGDIRAYLTDDQPPAGADDSAEGIYGVFIYPRTWHSNGDSERSTSTVTLWGTIVGCEMRLSELNPMGEPAAEWSLMVRSVSSLEGTRRDVVAKTSAPVELRVAAPVDCRGGTWRRFDSPLLPVTFEYPDSWRVDVREGTVSVECPDPQRLAFGGRPIELSAGTGGVHDVELENRRHAQELGGFRSFRSNEWWFGNCEERPAADGLFCRRATRTVRNGIPVLRGSAGEHRLYRPVGGYMGQGPGVVHYVFLLNDRWLEVTSFGEEDEDAAVTRRLVQSITARSR